MKSFGYEDIPVPLQNIVCTAYGLRQRYQMYGGKFGQLYESLRANERAAPERLEARQLERLRGTLRSAVEQVEYYRSRRNEYEVSGTFGWDDFRRLPFVEKEAVRVSPDAFLIDNFSRLQTIVGKTSGTTGTPMRIVASYDAFRHTWAAMERMRAWAGVSRHHRRASLTGKVFVPTSRDPGGIYWRYDWVGKRMLLSVYHLNDATVPLYVKALSKFQPAFIDGYPNAIARIAEYLRSRPDEQIKSLVAAFPTAETLTRELRQTIADGLKVKVFNQYGSTELSCHAGECEYGRMHISPEIGIVEILDDNGVAVGPGETGNIVLTGLVNEAMPLIRYKIGDMAVAADDHTPCACGRTLPVLGHVIGRNDDLVKTPDGRRLSIMNYHIIKVACGIKEAQLIQDDFHNFRIVAVPDGVQPVDLSRSITELNARLGYEANVTVTIAERVERTSAGKLRSVISHVRL